ncbi:MAG: hypothetical protein HFF26_08420 [Oscillospiraceae bacterium]|nr:hypothetical protein [Oscillospiraceae bacterium]
MDFMENPYKKLYQWPKYSDLREKMPMSGQEIAGILCVLEDFFTQSAGALGRKDVC